MSASFSVRLSQRYSQHRRDVVRHRLHPRMDRLKPFESQQVQGSRLESGHRTGTVAPVAIGVLLELGIADTVPTLDTRTTLHQS